MSQKKKIIKRKEKEPKETDCYYPGCRKKGNGTFGKKDGHFLLCEEHYLLAIFIRDMFDFNFENR